MSATIPDSTSAKNSGSKSGASTIIVCGGYFSKFLIFLYPFYFSSICLDMLNNLLNSKLLANWYLNKRIEVFSSLQLIEASSMQTMFLAFPKSNGKSTRGSTITTIWGLSNLHGVSKLPHSLYTLEQLNRILQLSCFLKNYKNECTIVCPS